MGMEHTRRSRHAVQAVVTRRRRIRSVGRVIDAVTAGMFDVRYGRHRGVELLISELDTV